jgi:photosystem II stability/assembly factor-like uncharacterized protein
VPGKEGGMGCIVAFADADNGWIGSGNKFEMTTDGGVTFSPITLPAGAGKVASMSLRTPKDGYLIDSAGMLYITSDGGKTWTPKSLGFTNPEILGFGSGPFINETPKAAVRFTDADNGVVVLGLKGKTSMIALRTNDGGNTWKEETLPVELGTPYLSPDSRFLTINNWGDGLIVLKYE